MFWTSRGFPASLHMGYIDAQRPHWPITIHPVTAAEMLLTKAIVVLDAEEREELRLVLHSLLLHLRRLRSVLKDPERHLALTQITLDLEAALATGLAKLATVRPKHVLHCLCLTTSGRLALRVQASLRQVGNKTPLEVVVRGLLVPGELRQVQQMAETLARQEVAKFVSRIETLKLVIRRGGKSRVEWGGEAGAGSQPR